MSEIWTPHEKLAEGDRRVPNAVKMSRTTRRKSAQTKWNVQTAVKTIRLIHNLATFIKWRKIFSKWITRKISAFQKLGKYWGPTWKRALMPMSYERRIQSDRATKTASTVQNGSWPIIVWMGMAKGVDPPKSNHGN